MKANENREKKGGYQSISKEEAKEKSSNDKSAEMWEKAANAPEPAKAVIKPVPVKAPIPVITSPVK